MFEALNLHHGYEKGSVTNYEPASNRELAEMWNKRRKTADYKLASKRALRFLTDHGGSKQYTIACHNETIGSLLARWNREFPVYYSDLTAAESGRRPAD